MSKAFVLLNHTLTQNQTKELESKFSIKEIVYPEKELSQKWSQIPAAENVDMGIIQSIVSWLSIAQENDVLIVQGEFGSTFMIVDYALKNKLIPVHAVTKRVAKESRDGETVHREYIFEHVCFRKYKYFEKNKINLSIL